MSWKGRLEFRDIGPGQWVLRTPKGDVALFGEVEGALAGQQVIVEGEAVDAHTNTMAAGAAVVVRRVTPA